MLGTTILQALSRDPESGDYAQVAPTSDIVGALDTLSGEFPDLDRLVSGKTVLDFGCGSGRQSVALAKDLGAVVTGVDTNSDILERAVNLASSYRLPIGACQFTSKLDGTKYDVIVTQNAMEHFPDPAAILQTMKEHLKPDGQILVTFSPPWFAPYGHHMHFFCKLPWLNLMFSEKTVMKVRARYRSDGATRYTEVESGLNKMTLAKFERLVRESGLKVARKNYRGVKGLDFLTKIPVIRELFTNRVTCVLELKA